MSCLRSAAFLLILIGIGGITGAIETGTSPVNAVAVFLIGCLMMAAYIKAESISCWKEKNYGKEKVMSGFEKEELQTRAKGMTLEEQAVVAGSLKDEVLWKELHQRFSDRSNSLEKIINETAGRSVLPDYMKIGSATDQSYRT